MEKQKLIIGVLGCGYECEELIDRVLGPWITLKNNPNCPYQFIFSFVHGQFKEYVGLDGLKKPYIPNWAQGYKSSIDFFITPEPGSEAELRNLALRPLLQAGCDLIYLLDLQDEIYKAIEIEKTLKFVENNPFIAWFKGSLKNYVFDHRHYLAEPFTPARIYRTDYRGLKLKGFRFDNEMVYQDTVGRIGNNIVDHLQLPHLTLPKSVCWTTHYTWMSDEKGKKKCKYQAAHFGFDLCSYIWNDEKNVLEFNPAYYTRFNLPFPEVVEESS